MHASMRACMHACVFAVADIDVYGVQRATSGVSLSFILVFPLDTPGQRALELLGFFCLCTPSPRGSARIRDASVHVWALGILLQGCMLECPALLPTKPFPQPDV